MKKNLISICGLILINISAFSQVKFTKFEIPIESEKNSLIAESNNCESCNASLDPALQEKTTYYKQSNLRDWLYQYFKSNEEQRRVMKNSAAQDINLSAVVKSIPIKFGYNSSESKEYNYWNNKHIEWTNTRLISIDDIAYLFKADSKDQLQAWLECKKISCGFTSANYADKSIFLDIEKIRDGKYNISLTNLSLANIKITDIQADGTIEKETGKDFSVNNRVSNKGGKISAVYSSKSTIDVDFSISVTYNILGTDDKGTTNVIYRIKPKLPDAPIGTIIATTLTYEQFLRINQIENLSSSEQIWLPCDGRAVQNGNFITKTPDLRGVFIRGANVMDKNENLNTKPVDKMQINPQDIPVGTIQLDAFQGHKHFNDDQLVKRGDTDLPNQPDQRPNQRYSDNSAGIYDAGYGTPRISTETRPINITVIYLIRVR